MKKEFLLEQWLNEERIAHIKGWDFSHIADRYEEEDKLPWEYEKEVKKYLKKDHKILDIDTGGGEVLLSLGHPNNNISATEAYPPNVQLCKEKLIPLGIDFKEANGDGILPYDDNVFDIVINRHGAYNPAEIFRVLKKGGLFITQQVGAENDRDLVELVFEEPPQKKASLQYMSVAKKRFEEAGFEILNAQEAFCKVKFWDVGALVWFARIIQWEFVGFNVQENINKLYDVQEKLVKEGVIEGHIHRFFLIAKKL